MANKRRLIDADKLCLKILDGSYWNDADEDVFWEMVQDEPTVEEAVIPVRCKECRHMTPVEGGLLLCCQHDTACAYDDFCSYGEKREVE